MVERGILHIEADRLLAKVEDGIIRARWRMKSKVVRVGTISRTESLVTRAE